MSQIYFVALAVMNFFARNRKKTIAYIPRHKIGFDKCQPMKMLS